MHKMHVVLLGSGSDTEGLQFSFLSGRTPNMFANNLCFFSSLQPQTSKHCIGFYVSEEHKEVQIKLKHYFCYFI